MGQITNFQAKLTLKSDFKPVFLKARPIPFAIKEIVEGELQDLVDQGVFIKVDHSRWATPIVPVRKADHKIRICGDYKITVNPNLEIDKHPLPTIEELFASMAGGDKFTKIDLTKAYLQLEVSAEDREILTLNTHKGLYQPTRLMYGVASAPAIWQRHIEQILQDIPGVSVFLDDIKITGPDDHIHLLRLEEVLKRLSSYNMRVNVEKCEFLSERIEYCGYVIDRKGIHKMKNKIEAIQDMPRPQNREQIRAFVGLVNYYGRFLKNSSTLLYPINNLLKKEVPFQWSSHCEEAFTRVKNEMQHEGFLVHYDPRLPLILATDASHYGVGAVLSHLCPDGSERPIQYASKTLNVTQQRYSQIDKEAFAIIFGIRKFYQFLYARKFTLITDNKPLLQIFSPHKGLPTMSAMRMQHYAIFLQSFNYEICYRNTKLHGNADAMSRLPAGDIDKNKIEEIDIVEINMIETLPVTVPELAAATAEDKRLKNLLQGLKNGRLVEPYDRFNIDQLEFSIQGGCLLRGIRVYIPTVLRKRILDELHSTHFGVIRMKSFARGYCWWENIDRDIEEIVRNCTDCQMVRPNPSVVPKHCWEHATEPFQRVHIDFAGPFKGVYFLVYVDAYSKWPEVRVLRNITAGTTIEVLREIFSTFGIPMVLVSDRGTQLTSAEFENFLKMNGVTHKMGAPYHPATNGQAERYVQTIKNKLKILKCDKDNLQKEICNILLTYRKMIHPTTGKSPSMMVFNRQIRSRIDLIVPKDSKGREEISDYIKVREFQLGDRVAVREYLERDIKWRFGLIINRLGKLHYSIRLDDGRLWTRHIDQMRKIGPDVYDSGVGRDDDLDRNSNIDKQGNNEMSNEVFHPSDITVVPPQGISDKDTPIATHDDVEVIARTPSVVADSSSTEIDKLPAQPKIENPAVRRSDRVRRTPIKLDL